MYIRSNIFICLWRSVSSTENVRRNVILYVNPDPSSSRLSKPICFRINSPLLSQEFSQADIDDKENASEVDVGCHSDVYVAQGGVASQSICLCLFTVDDASPFVAVPSFLFLPLSSSQCVRLAHDVESAL